MHITCHLFSYSYMFFSNILSFCPLWFDIWESIKKFMEVEGERQCEGGLPCLRVVGFQSWLLSQFQLPASAHLAKQQVLLQWSESMTPTSETPTEFWAPRFVLVQLWLQNAFREWTRRLKEPLRLSPPPSVCVCFCVHFSVSLPSHPRLTCIVWENSKPSLILVGVIRALDI